MTSLSSNKSSGPLAPFSRHLASLSTNGFDSGTVRLLLGSSIGRVLLGSIACLLGVLDLAVGGLCLGCDGGGGGGRGGLLKVLDLGLKCFDLLREKFLLLLGLLSGLGFIFELSDLGLKDLLFLSSVLSGLGLVFKLGDLGLEDLLLFLCPLGGLGLIFELGDLGLEVLVVLVTIC